MTLSFSNIRQSRLSAEITASATRLFVEPGDYYKFAQESETGTYTCLLVDHLLNRELVTVDIDSSTIDDGLLVTRGGGARAWKRGTIIVQVIPESELDDFFQEGTNRTGAHDPNIEGVSVAYMGEKFYDSDHVAWFMGVSGTTWKLIAGTVQVATPTFSPAAGEHAYETSITISCADAFATIYYTTDGSAPTDESTEYTGALTLPDTGFTLKAIAYGSASYHTPSSVATGVYTVTPEATADPVFDPVAGEYDEGQSITITCATSGATIYYTTDGSDPDETDTEYTGAITLTEDVTLKARAYGPLAHQTASNVVTAAYTVASGTVEWEFVANTRSLYGSYGGFIEYDSKVYALTYGRLYEVTDTAATFRVNTYSAYNQLEAGFQLGSNLFVYDAAYNVVLRWTGSGPSWTALGGAGVGFRSRLCLDPVADGSGKYWGVDYRYLLYTTNGTSWYNAGTLSGSEIYSMALRNESGTDYLYYMGYGGGYLYKANKAYPAYPSAVVTSGGPGYYNYGCWLLNGSIYAIGTNGYVYRYNDLHPGGAWITITSSAPDNWSTTSSHRHRWCVHNNVIYVVQQFNNWLWSWDETNGWKLLVNDDGGYGPAIDVIYWNGYILCLCQGGQILKYQVT